MAFDLTTAKPIQSGGFDLSTAKPVGPDTSEPTISERLLGTPAARFAIGAATPVVGALQLGANLGDRLAKKLGLDPSLGPMIAEQWNNLIAAKNKGMAYDSPERYLGATPTDFLGTAGVLTGAMVGGPAAAATKLGQVAQGARVGAALGVAQPGTTSLAEQGTSGALGATLGAAVPIVAPYAVKAVGWVGDRLSGPTLAQLRAAKIARDAAGTKLPEIQQAVAQARPGITAAQAIEEAGINSPPMQALGRTATRGDSTWYSDMLKAQEAARPASIKQVTPDLDVAVGARSVISDLNYGKAFASDEARQAALAQQAAHNNAFGGTGGTIPVERVSPELQALRGNPEIEAALKEAQSRVGGNPMETLNGLHTMKLVLGSWSKNPSLPTSLQNVDKAAIDSARSQLVTAIEKQFPDYKLARTDHTAMSIPVEQSKILNQLTEVLDNAGVGERGMPFLNALGRGEDAMIKRAGADAAFGGLEQKLAPYQMTTVNKVADEIARDARMVKSATEGTTELAKIFEGDTLSLRKVLPNVMNRSVSTIAKGSDLIEAALNKKTLAAISEAGKSGQSMAELFNVIPMSERNKILKAMLTADPTMLRNAAVVGSTNALSSRKNQNALSPP